MFDSASMAGDVPNNNHQVALLNQPNDKQEVSKMAKPTGAAAEVVTIDNDWILKTPLKAMKSAT